MYEKFLAKAIVNGNTTKNAAFNILRSIASSLDNDFSLNYDSLEITVEDFVKLLAHFMPAMPKKPKTLKEWVALPTKNTKLMGNRDFLRFLACSHGMLAGCDSRNVHIINADGLEDGYYCPKTYEKADPELKRPPLTTYIDSSLLELPIIETIELSTLTADVESCGSFFTKIGEHLFPLKNVREALSFHGVAEARVAAPGTLLVLSFADGSLAAICH